MQSALDFLNAATPFWTFSIVGLGLISEYTSYGNPSLSSKSVTLEVTLNLIRSGSEATKAFLKPLFLISATISLIEPLPW